RGVKGDVGWIKARMPKFHAHHSIGSDRSRHPNTSVGDPEVLACPVMMPRMPSGAPEAVAAKVFGTVRVEHPQRQAWAKH
ncbi:hypothetical protein ABTP39_19280, partial [Acinetobacter baumannii]